LGDFDIGKDTMTIAQRDAIVNVTAKMCLKFNLQVNSDSIIYHHWFDLSTGERNNGAKNNKSCPGSNFFGGNTVADCERNFLPLILAKLSSVTVTTDTSAILKYACVKADALNVRTKPSGSSPLARDRDPLTHGAVVRVYQEKNRRYKISGSKQQWVSARFTVDATHATVNANVLNVRSGPGTNFSTVGAFMK
jgi:hypothetical protein